MKTVRDFLIENDSDFNENFRSWFGDSKVVDESGQPLVVYHGSKIKNIQVFDITKIGSNTGNYGHYGYGIYFSEDIREAKTYGDEIYQCYIAMTKPFVGNNRQILELKNAGVTGIDDIENISVDFQSLKDEFRDKKYIYDF
jgi:hypothetical protein